MGANFPTTFHQVPIERHRPERDHLHRARHAVCALTTVGLRSVERSVVVIESAVRNVGVALVLARALLSPAELAIIASFLIGYFLIELIIMISYAIFAQRDNAQLQSTAIARDELPG